jgi:hypothetical protein
LRAAEGPEEVAPSLASHACVPSPTAPLRTPFDGKPNPQLVSMAPKEVMRAKVRAVAAVEEANRPPVEPEAFA